MCLLQSNNQNCISSQSYKYQELNLSPSTIMVGQVVSTQLSTGRFAFSFHFLFQSLAFVALCPEWSVGSAGDTKVLMSLKGDKITWTDRPQIHGVLGKLQ